MATAGKPGADKSVEDRLAIRELVIKLKVYKFISLFFIMSGFVIFLVLYYNGMGGDPMRAIKDPMMILYVIIPFMPALAVSFMARKVERELKQLIDKPKS